MDLLPALTETWQSGEALARRLGKTRQAVAKAASRLAAEGFPIERGKQGYRLAPGTPAPQNLGPRLKGRFGRPYRYLGTVTSTQDELRNLAEAGAPEGAVVLAEVQTAGRGRRGRRWESPGSGLYFSLLLRPRSPLSALALLPLAAGVALARAAGVGGLKWPNDLVVPLSSEGESAWAKLGGILLEADILGEEIRYALLGVGLNVAEAGLPQGAAGLARFFPGLRRDVLLARLLFELERAYALLDDPEALLSAYEVHSLTLSRRVEVRWVGGVVEGVAEAVLPDGALKVRSGRRGRVVTAGDVSLVGGLPRV